MILDTVAISALAEGDSGFGAIVEGVPKVHLPVIALGEFRYGIERSRYKAELLRWLSALIELHDVLYINLKTLDAYSTIRTELRLAGTPIPANDIWIAALALQYRLAVVSRDNHYDKVKGIDRISW